VFIGDARPYTIDNAGSVNLRADFRGNYGAPDGFGLWRYGDNNLTPVVPSDVVVQVEDKPANFAGIFSMGTPTSDSAFFIGNMQRPYLAMGEGIWLTKNSVIQKIFLQGETLPNSSETWFDTFPGRSAAGRLVFHARTLRQNGTNQVGRDSIWFADIDLVPQLLAMQDSYLTGLVAGQTIRLPGGPMINERGDAAFTANFTGINTTNIVGQGIWVRRPTGELQLAAKTGDPVEINGHPTTLEPSYLVSLNGHGQLLFRGRFRSGLYSSPIVEGLWIQQSDGSRRLIAHDGNGPNSASIDAVFGNFYSSYTSTNVFFNDSGKVAFSTTFYRPSELAAKQLQQQQSQAGVDGDDVGPIRADTWNSIWTEDHGTLKLIAKAGDILPGVDQPLIWADPMGLNNAGQLLFIGSLTPEYQYDLPVKKGLWAQDASGALQLIIKTGAQLDVAPGPEIDLRTVASFDVPFASEPGGNVGFNDLGQVLLTLRFTDGTNGTFIGNSLATVPEPNALAIIAVAVLLSSARWRARHTSDPDTTHKPGTARTTSARAARTCT
jgi:hypothetical protein